MIIEARAASEVRGEALPAPVPEYPRALSGFELHERVKELFPPSYSPPTGAQITRAKQTVSKDCHRANVSGLERAVATLERGARDTDIMKKAYGCLLSHHVRRRTTAEGEELLARAVSVMPPHMGEEFRSEWLPLRLRTTNEKLVEVTLIVPEDAGVFLNGFFSYPPTAPSSRKRSQQPLRMLSLTMVPGEYFAEVQGFGAVRISVTHGRRSLFVLSPELRESLRGGRLLYSSMAERNDDHAFHASLLAIALDCESALVYWLAGNVVHFTLVTANSPTSRRHLAVPLADAVRTAEQLLSRNPPSHVPPDFSRPQPGHVAVHVDSKRAQRVAVQSTSLWSGAGSRVRAVCEAPCTMYLPPGRAVITSGSREVAGGKHQILVDDTGNELALRSPSRGWNTAGKVVAGVGSGVFLGAGVLTVLPCGAANAVYDRIPGLPERNSQCPLNKTTGAVLAASAAVAGLGLGIWFGNRPGVADRRTLDAPGMDTNTRRGAPEDESRRTFLGVVPAANGFTATLGTTF